MNVYQPYRYETLCVVVVTLVVGLNSWFRECVAIFHGDDCSNGMMILLLLNVELWNNVGC